MLKKSVNPKDILLRFEREPDNEFDCNAVIVYISIVGKKNYIRVGYVSRDLSEFFSYVLLNSDIYDLCVYDIVLLGGTKDKPNVGLFFRFNVTFKES